MLGLIGTTLLALFTAYTALFAPPHNKNHLVPMYGVLFAACCCIGFFILLLRMAKTYLEVTDEQITQHTPGKPPLALTWSDITKVKTNKSSQRLELRSNITSQAIMIEYQVQGFDELRDIIARQTGQTAT